MQTGRASSSHTAAATEIETGEQETGPSYIFKSTEVLNNTNKISEVHFVTERSQSWDHHQRMIIATDLMQIYPCFIYSLEIS